jgi:protein-S-isoprenylcysteine O-methyltransferase Ste14
MKAGWAWVRWLLVGLVLGASYWLFFSTLRHGPDPQSVPFQAWYGNWRAVGLATVLFLLFLLGFAWPRRRAEWRNAGLTAAFFISLFAEMFGVPLTIFLLAPLLSLSPSAFGHNESHLWAFALDRLGLLPLHFGVYLVMVVSIGLLALGLGLLAVGWATVYRGRGELVTSGIYRHLRHPQYLGLILIVLGFNIQWPTLPTLLMAPVLITMYVRLGRREDEELARRFGQAFLDYAERTPALIPWRRSRDRFLERIREDERLAVSEHVESAEKR